MHRASSRKKGLSTRASHTHAHALRRTHARATKNAELCRFAAFVSSRVLAIRKCKHVDARIFLEDGMGIVKEELLHMNAICTTPPKSCASEHAAAWKTLHCLLSFRILAPETGLQDCRGKRAISQDAPLPAVSQNIHPPARSAVPLALGAGQHAARSAVT
eukprot:1151281-Pelagomonas_calceolata.AAC.1